MIYLELMELIILKEETIRDFLRTQSKGMDSKDYEFLVAIVLKRFVEEQLKKDCLIGFKLKNKYAAEIPNSGSTNMQQISDILRKKIDEDTPIDVVIVLKPIARRVTGPAFQLKRFGRNPEQRGTNDLIEYLNRIPKKYTKVSASLFLILEGNREINFKKIQQSLVTKGFPFQRIMFMAVVSGKIRIGEIWPNKGMNEYDPQDFLSTT